MQLQDKNGEYNRWKPPEMESHSELVVERLLAARFVSELLLGCCRKGSEPFKEVNLWLALSAVSYSERLPMGFLWFRFVEE